MNDGETPREIVARASVADRLMHAGVARRLLGSGEGLAVTVGRFVVLERVGSGGMGVVYRAYDPELNRPVALKLLPPQSVHSDAQADRLLREASALARLNHPNVVTVHDAGRSGDEVFVAMELVDGVDLGTWVVEHPHGGGKPDRARLGIALDHLQQAGQGLAAAHRVDLVHRDFKPANVLIGADGRVRVADFGLALPMADSPSIPDGVLAPEQTSGSGPGLVQTASGLVLGTLRYMAPEQRAGETVDQRADQFAFCVTAWEVLLGAHPWPQHVATDAPPKAPADAPPWIAAALARGLQSDPARRYHSMDELLVALRPAAPWWRSPWVALAGVASLSVVATTGAMQMSETPSPCVAAAERVGDVWTAQRREVVLGAAASAEGDHVAATARLLVDRLDAHAAQWSTVARDTCEAAATGLAPQPDAWAHHQACLDNRLLEFEALVTRLEQSDAHQSNKAIDAVFGLDDIDLCSDLAYVTATAAPHDATLAPRVQALRTELANASALSGLGKSEQARTMLTAALPVARELDHAPLTVDLLLLLARLNYHGHDRTGGVALLAEAFEIAISVGYDHGAYDTSRHLIYASALVGQGQEAAIWERVAVGLHERVGIRSPERWASLLHYRGMAAATRGERAQGREYLEQGVATLEAMDTPSPGALALVLNALANMNLEAGDYALAFSQYQRAVKMFEEHYGPEHPASAVAQYNLGVAYYFGGELDLARKQFERALVIRRAAFGGKGPAVGDSLTALANVHAEQGETTKALAFALEAVALHRDSAAPLALATALSNVSLIHKDLGDNALALQTAQEALQLREQHSRPESPDLGESLLNLAGIYAKVRDYPRAFEAAHRGIAIYQKLGETHPDYGAGLAVLAQLQVATGDLAAARANYERALSILPPGHPGHGDASTAYERIKQSP